MDKAPQESRKPENHVQEWIESQQTAAPKTELSIIVPAYNEERRLPPTLIDIIDFMEQREIKYEILVVDDGSTDKTAEVIQKFERIRPEIRGIILPKNYGKGHAVRTGALNAEGNLILFTDADGATPIEEYLRLLPEIEKGFDVVIGSRAIASDETQVTTRWYRKFLGRIFNFCVNTFLVPDIADTQCGFKLFSRRAARFLFEHQKSDRFSFDIELLFLSRQAQIPITEIAINWTNIPGSKVNLLTDSISMFIDIFRFSLRHRGISPKDYNKGIESP